MQVVCCVCCRQVEPNGTVGASKRVRVSVSPCLPSMQSAGARDGAGLSHVRTRPGGEGAVEAGGLLNLGGAGRCRRARRRPHSESASASCRVRRRRKRPAGRWCTPRTRTCQTTRRTRRCRTDASASRRRTPWRTAPGCARSDRAPRSDRRACRRHNGQRPRCRSTERPACRTTRSTRRLRKCAPAPRACMSSPTATTCAS